MPVDQDIIFANIEDRGLLRQLERAPDGVRAKARRAVRAVSFAVEKRIKLMMPVDTGRARASWGHWTPGDLEKANFDASRADADWEQSLDGLTITQGSNVEYIDMLNNGHSEQAPVGFIDTSANVGGIELEKEIARIIDEEFG